MILLKSVAVSKLQVAIIARSSREMSLTLRIDWKHFLSRVRVSVRPRNGFHTRKTHKSYRECLSNAPVTVDRSPATTWATTAIIAVEYWAKTATTRMFINSVLPVDGANTASVTAVTIAFMMSASCWSRPAMALLTFSWSSSIPEPPSWLLPFVAGEGGFSLPRFVFFPALLPVIIVYLCWVWLYAADCQNTARITQINMDFLVDMLAPLPPLTRARSSVYLNGLPNVVYELLRS